MGEEPSVAVQDFAQALCSYVAGELRMQDGAYIRGAVKILDARNQLFRTLPHQQTDELEDIYALADLCMVCSEGTDEMQTVPDKNRALSVARNYFS